jgi:serine/threonine-protein kinase
MLIAGRYELGAALGSGGFATVYRARDRVEAREVALKLVPLGGDAAAHFERFRHEALALSRLRSKYLARVYDFGKDDRAGLYLAMELVDGVPLDLHSIGRPLQPHQVLRVARGLLGGLAVAHASGVVHRDVKPANVLVPRGERMLEEPRLIDFGIAVTRRPSGRPPSGRGDDTGPVLGTPSYMAPEQLANEPVGPEADVYSAGLVLFELLGVGPLFQGESLSERLRARLTTDPPLADRVPSPLSALFERMLARSPAARFPTAREALEAVLDLDTAPVAVDELLGAPPPSERPVLSVNASLAPPGSRSSLQAGTPVHPLASYARRLSKAPSGIDLGARRLTRLSLDPDVALRETLHALDVAMLDALARRERGSNVGRIARAISLALRLELDASALILEPLAPQSDVARAVGTCMVAPRARRVTRARVDADREDSWVGTIDRDLGASMCVFGSAMTTREDAARSQARCTRMIERMGAARSPLVVTLRMAERTASCLAGTSDTTEAIRDLLRLRDADDQAPSAFDVLMRALLLGALGFRADEHLAREQLERAARLAAETGSTLLEARAMVAWGGMLVEIPGRVEQGLHVLERATTLLAHGDVPTLEHIAEHNRGAALLILGRWADAVPHFRRAREAAMGERSREHELASITNEAMALLCLGERSTAQKLLDELSDVRLNASSPRTAAFGHVARALGALASQGIDAARSEALRGLSRASEAGADAGDAYLMAELLTVLLQVARGEPVDLLARAGEIEQRAQDIGFVSFYWFDILRATIAQQKDPAEREKLEATRARLLVMLGPPGDPACGGSETPSRFR